MSIELYREYLKDKSAVQVIDWALEKWGENKLIAASSMGAEDQVITDMLALSGKKFRIFTIDTGRLFQETYDVMEKTMSRYGFRYEVMVPDTSAVQSMVNTNGPNLFYESREKRIMCCTVRKKEPLRRILHGVSAWICGLRREQGLTRKEISPIEWDDINNLYKINPIFNWTDEEVWEYIRKRNIPYNKLHDSGFCSIGCMPCTRANKAQEDKRAGRWWWEAPEHKECGLHK